MRTRIVLLAATAVLMSCGDAPQSTPSAVARFAPSAAAPMAWGDVPFPSDLYRDAAGVIRIGALPTPLSEGPLFSALRDVFAARDGFCATCNAYFVIDGDLDPSLLPADQPDRQPARDDAVLLADVDDASPERGRLFPLRLEWNPQARTLALRPVRGIALHRRRRYAAALTTDLRALDGSPLAPSAAFRQARDGARSSDAAIERARVTIEPALAELERIGVAR